MQLLNMTSKSFFILLLYIHDILLLYGGTLVWVLGPNQTMDDLNTANIFGVSLYSYSFLIKNVL